ncbi:hypothetical protein C8Q74DRAFT_1287432 [Fomes fomentarius]|nr:hypothetical protein C8Q74DRAFT_1287432 [Fomes fomentarius]
MKSCIVTYLARSAHAHQSFDVMDLPEEVKPGAKEVMRVHLECRPAGDVDEGENFNVKLTVPFYRNKDSARYGNSVTTAEQLGDKFVSACRARARSRLLPRRCFLSFPLGRELEMIPTEI